MKLLDWMHQKVRKGGIIPFKDRSAPGPTGSCYTCISKHDDPKQAPYNTMHTSNWKETMRNEAVAAKHEIFEESFTESPVIFQGFLSIGFLGLEPIISEPVTPTFNTLTEGHYSVTDNELRFINDELEKFLENEVDEETITIVSSGRNSQASVISLANIQQGDDSNEEEPVPVCPLQDYLFGSTIELPHSGEEKKRKMSLEELFRENEKIEKYPDEDECKGEQNIHTKKHNKFTLPSLKKLLKKLKSANSPRPADRELVANSTRNKFNKIMKMLRRKVHPEKNDETGFSKNEASEIGERHETVFAENKEQWIKTDTDYFVLEL